MRRPLSAGAKTPSVPIASTGLRKSAAHPPPFNETSRAGRPKARYGSAGNGEDGYLRADEADPPELAESKGEPGPRRRPRSVGPPHGERCRPFFFFFKCPPPPGHPPSPPPRPPPD